MRPPLVGQIVKFPYAGGVGSGYVTRRDDGTGKVRVCLAPGEYVSVDPSEVEVLNGGEPVAPAE